MQDNEKLIALAIVISLIGTASLYVYAANQEVVHLEISDIDHDLVGMKVNLEGVISRVRGAGTIYLLELREIGDNNTLDLVIEEQVMASIEEKNEVMPGAHIQVRGIIETYDNDISLRVTVPGELEILEEAYSRFTPIASLLENPYWYSGMEVKVRGRVTEVSSTYNGTYFEIRELDGGHHRLGCFVQGIDLYTELHIVEDDPLVFKGTYGYDTSTGRWLVRGEISPDVRT